MNKEDKYNYLAKNTILFTISSFGSKILTFLLVPLYTAVLSTSEYGTADLVTTTAGLLIYVFTLNIADSVLRFAIDRKSRQEEILSYGIQILIKGSGIFLIAIAIAWKFSIVDWPNYCYIFLFLSFFTTALNQILSNYLRAIDKVFDVAVAGIILTAITIISNIVFLLWLKLGLLGYMLASVLGACVSSLYCLLKTKCSLYIIRTSLADKETQKDMKAYSIPLIFNGVAWWINNSIDKYFVTAICGVAINGIYAVAYKIPTILTVFQSIFSQAWNLSAIKEFDKNDEEGFFSKTYETYQAGLTVLCSALIIMNIPIAHLLFAKDFFQAWEFSSVLLISLVFNALSGFLGSIFTAVKNSKIFAVSTVSAATVNIILNSLMIPTMGAQGAAIATAISFFMIWSIRLICARKYISLKINIIKDIIVYVLLIVQVVLEHLKGHMYWAQAIILMIIIALYWRQIWNLTRAIFGKMLAKLEKGKQYE